VLARRSAVRLTCIAAALELAAGNSAFARPAAVPASLSPPAISGSVVEGGLLTASNGSWSESPTRYTYVWKDCDSAGASCVKIAGATAGTYRLVRADVGHTVRVTVRAWNGSGSSTARSGQTAVARARPASSSDTTAPSTPANLASPGPTASQLTLTWSRSADNVGVTGYAIYLNGTPAGTTTNASYTFSALTCGTPYALEVEAFDAASNRSARPSLSASTAPCATAAGLHVSGNKLLDAAGKVVRLHGANYSGPEYACIQGWGIFDGPSDDASVAAMAAWRVNIVRLPLNEDCWLSINGVPTAYAGANYRNAIAAYVNLLHQHGMYAELSLIWGAPGTNPATDQPGAPDADHSPAFWTSLASTFKNDPNVILAPWGETIVNASCFLNGGMCEATYGSTNKPYAVAGMQEAVNLMRQAGYNGVIAIPGIDYANNLSQWLSHKPSDPLGQLMAEAHVYGKNTCDTTACFDRDFAPVAASVPLMFGETGNSYDDSVCGSSYVATFMNWADAHGVGYQAWTWDTWSTCGSLINNFNGTPNGAYGTYVKNHYATLP
jgi:endoglucanase